MIQAKGLMRMNWPQMTDGELVAAFATDGAEAAFAEFVSRHATMVFRTCRRITGSHQDAEDATQAVFATVVVRAHHLSGCTSLSGWLYSAAWHVSRRYRRSNLTRRQRELHATPVMPVAGDELDGEVANELYRALEMLPADYRDAVVLHHLEGCTIQQVADVMGTSIGTTAARLSRARAMMRERLSWRGILMTDAMLTAFIVGDLALEPAPESAATHAAMAGAATASTDPASAALTLCATGGAGVGVSTSAATGIALYAGLRATQWIAVALVTLVVGGTAAVTAGVMWDGKTRVRMSESASASRSNRSAARLIPTVSFESTGRVPEPSCLGIIAAGGLLLRRKHRRDRAS